MLQKKKETKNKRNFKGLLFRFPLVVSYSERRNKRSCMTEKHRSKQEAVLMSTAQR